MKKVKSLLSDVIRLFLPAEEGEGHELAWSSIVGGLVFIVFALLMGALASGRFQ